METVKIGTVESVNGNRAKVRFQRERTASAELTVLRTDEESRWVPKPGEKVVCLMQSGGTGFIAGAI